MIKKLMAAALALTVCATLAGCGETEEVGSDSKATTTTTAAVEESSAAETAAEDDKEEEPSEKEEETDKSEEEEPVGEEEPAEEEPAEVGGAAADGFSNDVYSVSFESGKWIALTDYKDYLADVAAEQADLFDPAAFSAMLGGIYFYGEDINDNYASNVIFSNPTYDPTLADITMAEMQDVLVQSVEMQMSAVDFMQVTSNEMVSHSGIDMLCIKIHADTGDIAYDCEEYVFIRDSKLCIITFNYDTEDGGKAEFESMLDNITFV